MFSSILCSINYYNKLKLNSVTQLERSSVSSTLMIKSYVDCNTSDVTGIFVYVACGMDSLNSYTVCKKMTLV